jgi:hypothetical protein
MTADVPPLEITKIAVKYSPLEVLLQCELLVKFSVKSAAAVSYAREISELVGRSGGSNGRDIGQEAFQRASWFVTQKFAAIFCRA